MNDDDLVKQARELLDAEQSARAHELAARFAHTRRAALDAADAEPATERVWWLAGAAACVLAAVLVMPGLQEGAGRDKGEAMISQQAVSNDESAAELAELLDSLDLLLFFDEEGLDSSGQDDVLDDEWLG